MMTYESEIWNIDVCTRCMCKHGMIYCDVSYCPPTPCQNPTYDKRNSCCPVCPNTSRHSLLTGVPFNTSTSYWSCFDRFDQKKVHGTIWKEDDCIHCKCVDGQRICVEVTCKQKTKCTRQILKKGYCCPLCVDDLMTTLVSLSESMHFRSRKTSILIFREFCIFE